MKLKKDSFLIKIGYTFSTQDIPKQTSLLLFLVRLVLMFFIVLPIVAVLYVIAYVILLYGKAVECITDGIINYISKNKKWLFPIIRIE